VTLAAKPVDAARIIWAKEKGHITLVLRRPGEEEEGKVPQVTELGTTGVGPDGKTKTGKWDKVWVARENLFPSQIDKPDAAFELQEVPPNMAIEAMKGPNPPAPGRLFHMVVKGMPVTAMHFKPGPGGDVSPTGPTPVRGGITIVRVMTPNREVQYYKFGPNGEPLDDGKPTTEAPGGAAPQGGGSEGAGELK
jgi:hypothetical protein